MSEHPLVPLLLRFSGNLPDFFGDVPFAMEEILFDPQTSGGLLAAVDAGEAEQIVKELQAIGLPAKIVGRVTETAKKEIIVR